MREGRPSTTAGNIALARAWLTRAGIVDDPYARLFLSPRQANVERLLWWSRRTRLGQRAFAYLAARTRFYDAVVTDALDAGIDQVVLVGAGPHRLLRLLTRVWHERAGEPIITGIDPSAAPDLLTESGWTIKEILPAPTLQDRYLDPAELPFRFTHAGTFSITATRSEATDVLADPRV